MPHCPSCFESTPPNADIGSGLIAQTSRDDFPFFSFAMTRRQTVNYGDADWVCLLFAGPSLSRETIDAILVNEPFPYDYTPPLPADFMFLPFAFVRWQVSQTTAGIADLEHDIVQQDEELISTNDPRTRELTLRDSLFRMRRRHFMLQRRWRFAQELARNLARCFDHIEGREASQNPGKYSAKLRDGVQEQHFILGIMRHDLDNLTLRINAQQTVVRLLKASANPHMACSAG